MQKNKCPEFSHWYFLLVNVYQACNLFRNVEDPSKCICVFLGLYILRFLSLEADCFGITVT